MKKVFYFIILFFFISCSSEKTTDMGGHRPVDTEGNKVPSLTSKSESSKTAAYSLEIAPANATRNSTIYLIPHGFALADAEIEWFVNGARAVSPSSHQFKATETKKGDEVQAKAIKKGQEIVSNIIQIANSTPEISKVRILPEIFKPGDTLYVDVSGSDLDGDEVTITYEWTKNSEPAGNSKKIAVPLKRGDKVSVKITPFDGEVYGRSLVLHREIVNMPPMIIENRKFTFDGKVYSYQVTATDPDGDTLIYSLKTAPASMTINLSTGLIKWDVPPEFKGRASVSVSVTDRHGGEAMQSITIDITPEKR